MKTCSKCNTENPATTEHFAPRKKGSRDGLSSWCRACLRVASLKSMAKLWRTPGRKAKRLIAQFIRLTRWTLPLTVKERNARWRQRDPENALEVQRRYRRTERGLLKHRLQQSKRRAQMNGVITTEEWEATLRHWGNRCAYCRTTGKLSIDHIVPVSNHGLHTIENVVPACKPCNDKKSNSPLDVALARLGVPRNTFNERYRKADEALTERLG